MAKSATTTKPLRRLVFETELGWMLLVASQKGVVSLKFRYPTLTALRADSSSSEWSDVRVLGKPAQEKRELIDVPSWLSELVKSLRLYAAGQQVDFSKFPLDLAAKTPFQQRVIKACCAIPRGQTMTYGKLAVKAKAPGAARAVGSVMARNELALLIPCHRVVGSNGLHGFSLPGGIATKQLLLDLERERASMK
jgi:methylated-DNA-[protein]-cysteine S-methyltransferase